MLRPVSLEERPIVVLGLRGGLLGANPIPHRSYIPYRDQRLSISEEASGAFGKSQTYRYLSQDIQRIYELFVKCRGHRYRGRGYDKGQEAEQKDVKIMEDRRDKEQAEYHNTVKDRIMDSGASFHATYCKEELERFKLRSAKVRLANDMTLDIAGVGDVVLETYFDTSWTLKDVRIGMSMLASKGNVLDVRKVDIYFCKLGGLGKQKNLSFIMSVKTRKLQSRSCGRYNANLQVKCLKFDNGGEYSS
ncbi:hypothetical protein Tco_1437726 [Tanacetum coccineum]